MKQKHQQKLYRIMLTAKKVVRSNQDAGEVLEFSIQAAIADISEDDEPDNSTGALVRSI